MTDYQVAWLTIYANIVGMQHHPGKKEKLTYAQCAIETHLAAKYWTNLCQSSAQDYSSREPSAASQETPYHTPADKAPTPPTNK